MNYETLKLLCEKGDPEDTITLKIKDINLIVQRIESENSKLITFEELETKRYSKNFYLYCDFLECELTEESLTLLKTTSLYTLVRYYNEDSCSIRLLNCLHWLCEENNITALNDVWNFIFNKDNRYVKAKNFGKKSLTELMDMTIGIFKDGYGQLTFGRFVEHILDTRE